jgi:hypothetical protein
MATPFATEVREDGARIGHDIWVISFSRVRLIGESRLTRHSGSSRADDQRMRMTSLGVLVISVFE